MQFAQNCGLSQERWQKGIEARWEANQNANIFYLLMVLLPDLRKYDLR